MADPDTRRQRLDRIEAQIAVERRAYLTNTWAGLDQEARKHEDEVNRLLGVWQQVQHDTPITLVNDDDDDSSIPVPTPGL